MRKFSIITAFNFLVIFIFNLNAQISDYSNEFGSYRLYKSNEYYNEGLVRLSEETLDNSIKLFPMASSIDRADLLRADVYLNQGNVKLADDVLSEFIKERNNSPLKAFAMMKRAYIAFDNQDYPLAAEYFSKSKSTAESEFIVRGDSAYCDLAHASLFWNGISLMRQGKYNDAQPLFEECYRKYPTGKYADDALYALGISAETNRQYEAAISFYKNCVRRYPYSDVFIAAKLREINDNLMLKDYSNSFVNIEMAENTISHINARDSIGLLYEKQNYVDSADQEILYLRAEANNAAGNYKQAIEIFQKYIDKFPDSRFTLRSHLGLAWAFLNLKDYKNSIDNYDEVIAKAEKKDNYEISTAKYYRTIAIKRTGDIKQAQKEFSALSVQSDFIYISQVLLELGQIYYENEDYENAQRTLERADRESSDANTSIKTQIVLGATYVELRKWDKAIGKYKSAEQLILKSSDLYIPNKEKYLAETRLKQGIALIKTYRYLDAFQPLTKFIADCKDDKRMDEAMFWLAEAYYRADMLKNAIETYEKLLKKSPNTQKREEALYGLGWSYFRLKNFDKSSKIFGQMISEFPESKFSVEVLARQGDGYYVTKNFKAAEESYKKGAKIAPKTEDGQYCAYQLAHALYRLGSLEEAVKASMGYYKKYPNSAYADNALYLVGWIRFQQKKNGEAIDNFKYLIASYPNSSLIPRAMYAIGDAYYNSSNFEEAIGAYKEVIAKYPSTPLAGEALRSMQYCLESLGRMDEALKITNDFISANPQSPFAEEFSYKKGEMFYNGKRYKDAVQEYDDFAKRYPTSDKSAEALYWMGKSYQNLDQNEDASKSFEKVYKTYPKSDFAPMSMIEEALLQKQMNNISASEKILGDIEKNYPDNSNVPQAGFELALIKISMGDTLSGIDKFKAMATKFVGTEYGEQSRYKVAMYYKSKAMDDSARTEFELLSKNEVNTMLAAEAYFRIAELLMKEQKYDLAVQKLLELKDKFSGVEDWYSFGLLDLGECYENLKETDKALETYKALQTLRPDDEFGATAQRRLKPMENK